jgi:hypothetical protein
LEHWRHQARLRVLGSRWRSIIAACTKSKTPKGWVKPVTKSTRESLKARVAELPAELAEAEGQVREMEEGKRLEALVKVRNLMRAFQLMPTDLRLVPAPKRRGRPRKIVA